MKIPFHLIHVLSSNISLFDYYYTKYSIHTHTYVCNTFCRPICFCSLVPVMKYSHDCLINIDRSSPCAVMSWVTLKSSCRDRKLINK